MASTNKKYSRGRRIARVVVWVAFAAVLTLRFLFPPERSPRFEPRRDVFGQPRQFRRPPVQVNPPTSQVPADLWRIQIEMAPKDVATLRQYHWNGWRGARQERVDVPATVREGGQVYTNVALHLKGAAGSFRPFDDKPALTLNFSKNAPGQQFHGYTKISLNNSVQDPSYLAEAISRELFLAAGVPVPQADHATVIINNRDLGLYVLTEGFGKTFLKRHFKNVKGNLYDGGFVQDITGDLDTNSGDNPNDRRDLQRLMEAASDRGQNPTNRWQRLSQVLDMDRFISFVAMEIMTCHWDGYTRNRNNYRVFHDLGTDRIVFMPHGLDQMFGWARSSPNDPIDPQSIGVQGFVAQRVLATAEGRRLYWERVAALRTNVFLEDKIISRVRELARRIRPTLAAYESASQFDWAVDNLCQRISQRARSISEQLDVPKAAPQEPIRFDANGAARLSGWTRRVTSQPGGAFQFGKGDVGGTTSLGITVGRGGGSASWRTRVLLPAGRYRFEGRARTSGVGNTGGICLRISGEQRPDIWRPSDQGWMALRYEIVVREPEREVELLCELKAARGEAWFDEGSLRLIRE
ncbi:MAG: CotH kinase family protein [Verrucomicrobia bacterium]|nr:CotH kinase family protein [Verrucomicrobiota bacterium]